MSCLRLDATQLLTCAQEVAPLKNDLVSGRSCMRRMRGYLLTNQRVTWPLDFACATAETDFFVRFSEFGVCLGVSEPDPIRDIV
jgi:hypothetical protein